MRIFIESLASKIPPIKTWITPHSEYTIFLTNQKQDNENSEYTIFSTNQKQDHKNSECVTSPTNQNTDQWLPSVPVPTTLSSIAWPYYSHRVEVPARDVTNIQLAAFLIDSAARGASPSTIVGKVRTAAMLVKHANSVKLAIQGYM